MFNGGICGVSSFRFVPYNILYIPTESELKDTSSGLEITQQTVTQGHNIRWKENLAPGTKYIKFRHHAASVRFFFCAGTRSLESDRSFTTVNSTDSNSFSLNV